MRREYIGRWLASGFISVRFMMFSAWIYSYRGVSYFTYSYNSSRPLSHIIVFGMMNNLKYEYLEYEFTLYKRFLQPSDSCCYIHFLIYTEDSNDIYIVLSELKNLRQGALNAVDTVLFIKTDLYGTGPRSLLNRFRLHWNKAISSLPTIVHE